MTHNETRKNNMKQKCEKSKKSKNFEKKKKLKVMGFKSNFESIVLFVENAQGNDKNSDTFVERMQLQIIRNLELSIQNIHIVYEDKTTNPNQPFSFRITLNYISLHVKKRVQRENNSI